MSRAIGKRVAFALMALAGWYAITWSFLTLSFSRETAPAWSVGVGGVLVFLLATWPLASARPRRGVLRAWGWTATAWVVPLLLFVATMLAPFDLGPSVDSFQGPLVLFAFPASVVGALAMPIGVAAIAAAARPAPLGPARSDAPVAA